ncbi:hypothetical protein [Sulfuritalea sp.]|uniref:hypothetical protein n=1 Tax=Sulfuritalea sp. TaxID=2480090 RepID=UPI0025D12080|nr:hypothetical protein [Sulfuritalea sp.]
MTVSLAEDTHREVNNEDFNTRQTLGKGPIDTPGNPQTNGMLENRSESLIGQALNGILCSRSMTGFTAEIVRFIGKQSARNRWRARHRITSWLAERRFQNDEQPPFIPQGRIGRVQRIVIYKLLCNQCRRALLATRRPTWQLHD